MRIGSGIALVVVGAAFAFAVRDSFDGVDLTMLGYILLAAGVLVVALDLVMSSQKRTATTQQVHTDSAGNQQVTETRSESSPPPPTV